ncbi:MAG: AAA family ATPase [Alphaproteobacteria bacterium]|nr:AAA family ATPase [Alphaproteobacteria bacterium]MCB9696201.1 AAA family ATPase [Alphaproteobacteria bacterium]
MRNIGRASGAANVILVGLDNESMGMVREVLAAEAVLPSSSVGFGDALEVIDRARPDVVIVGYTRAVDASLQLAEELRRAYPNIVMVALADMPDSAAILGAMRAGYKEFVVLPSDANRLRQTVHGAAFHQADDEEKGRVISLIGSKGGVGVTTLAIHLAAELAGIHRVLVIDLDLGMGDVAPMMDLTSRDSIGDLVARSDRLDERMLSAAVVVHKSKVNVLTMPDDMQNVGEIRADDMYNIISVAALAYQWVIIDCGTFTHDAVTLALQVSDTTILTTTPDVTAVRDAYRRMRSFTTLGLEKERIRLVVNRWHKAAYVSKKDIAQNLGIPVAATVSDDPRHVEQAVNEGKLIRDVNRRCDAARDIATLVAILTDDGPVAPEGGGGPEGGSGGWLSGLFGRR